MMNLRDLAESVGVAVGWNDSGTGRGVVTLVSPAGQVVSFAADEGEQFGIGDRVGGSHIVSNAGAFLSALGLSSPQGGGSGQNQTTQGALADTLGRVVEQAPSYQIGAQSREGGQVNTSGQIASVANLPLAKDVGQLSLPTMSKDTGNIIAMAVLGLIAVKVLR